MKYGKAVVASVLLVAAAVIWSPFSIFCDNFPVSLVIPFQPSSNDLPDWWEREGKGREGGRKFQCSLQIPTRKLNGEASRESGIAPTPITFYLPLITLFLYLSKEISLKQGPKGYLILCQKTNELQYLLGLYVNPSLFFYLGHAHSIQRATLSRTTINKDNRHQASSNNDLLWIS